MPVEVCEHDYPVNSNCPYCERDYWKEEALRLKKELARLQEMNPYPALNQSFVAVARKMLS